MSRLSKLHTDFGKLEGALLLAIAALVFQLFPSLWFTLWSALDFRNWPRAVWFALNVLAIVGLFAIRFKQELYAYWRQRTDRSERSRSQQATAGVGEPQVDPDYEARVRRDADWRERAKKRLPWHS